MAVTLFDSSSQTNKPQQRKRAGGVRRRNETRDQFRGRMDGTTQSSNNNSDIDAIFRGIQQTRTRVHKDTSGRIMDPNAPQGLDKLYADNPHLKGGAQRQAQYDQQARGNAYQQAAQNSLMRAQEQQPTSKSVVGADGYRSIFDSSGNVVGTTAPVGDGSKRIFDDASGRMVPMNQWFNDRREVQASKGMTPTPMQQAAQRSMASKPSGMDQIFGGGTKQTSPSGVTNNNTIKPPQPKKTPNKKLPKQKPNLNSKNITKPKPIHPPNTKPQHNYTTTPNTNPQYNYTMTPNTGPQYTPMMPNEGPQNPSDFGPQLPYSGGEQLMALKRLYGFGGNTNPTLTALEGTWSNIFPGRKDYEYLRQLFPGLVHPQAGSGQVMTSLAQMYQNPAYQALFPRVNQSEFYQ